MKVTEIRGKDSRELKLDLADLSKEYFQLTYKGGAEAVARPHRFSEIRRTIARIRMVLAERARSEAVGAVPVGAAAAAGAAPAAQPPAKSTAKAGTESGAAKASSSKTTSPKQTKPKTSSSQGTPKK